MKSQEFLATVLPSSGKYCACELSTAKKEHVFVDTIDELYSNAAHFSGEGLNAFYALASFNTSGKRLATNAVKIKSLFLDIDCGEGKDYPNKQAAAAALESFLSSTSLNDLGTPYIVSSGGGLHVYWPFNEEVDIATWKPVAENLKRLCKKEALNIDAMVTGDAARVLRVPDTKNYKQEKPRSVAIKVVGTTFDFATLSTVIKNKVGEDSHEALPKFDLPGKRPDLKGTASNVKMVENSITFFKNLAPKCGQVQHYMSHAKDDGMEPLWRGILSIAKYCDDGEEEGLALSAMHPYDLDRHNTKWHQIKGPYSCLKLDEANPGVCKGCPHFGHITNPLALGREIKVDNKPKEIILETKAATEDKPAEQVMLIRPIPPRGFSYGANGGIFVDKVVEDAEGGEKSKKQVMILPYDLFVVDILDNGDEHLVHMIACRPNSTVDIIMPQKSVVSKDETVKMLASHNIIAVYGKGNDVNLYEYIRGCVEYASSNKVAIKVPHNCGWQDDNSFVYNSTVFFSDGKELYVPTPSMANINYATRPTGTLEEWKKVLNMYIAKELWEIVTMGMVGPASILMHFSGFRGVVYHLGSSGSGRGKSLALALAASFWGHPELYRVTQSTSAVAAQNRQGMLNSLPLVMDEITNKNRESFEWLPQFLLDLTQGKGKERMEQGANKERLNTTVWNLMVLFSSNTHIYDFLSGGRKHTSQAEMLRMLEVKPAKEVQWASSTESSTVDILKTNYGVVGRELIRWIVKNRLTAIQVYEETREKLKAEFNSSDDERYWTAGNAAIIAIVILMSKKYANIIDVPIRPIMETLRNMVNEARAAVRGNRRTAEDVLNAYTRECYGKFVVVKAIDGITRATLGGNNEIDQSLTRSDVAGRVEHEITPGHVEYFIEEQLLKQHCSTMSYGYSDLKKELETLPNYKVRYLRKDMLAKTRGPTMRVNVIQITRPVTIDEKED